MPFRPAAPEGSATCPGVPWTVRVRWPTRRCAPKAKPPLAGARGSDNPPDGQRFLMIKAAGPEGGAATQINVVLNWFEELKQRVPVK